MPLKTGTNDSKMDASQGSDLQRPSENGVGDAKMDSSNPRGYEKKAEGHPMGGHNYSMDNQYTCMPPKKGMFETSK